MLGVPSQEQNLRQVLQSLEEELCTHITALENRRQKIRTLLDEYSLESVDALPVDSPTFHYVQEQLATYHAAINPALWEQEAQLYALLDNLHWSEGQQTTMKAMADYFIQHFTEHPEEYQQLLALAERFTALATLPEDAPEVMQLVEDIDRYFVQYPFMLELQKQVGYTDQESPFSLILADLLTPILSSGQRSVLNKITRRQAKEGNT